MHYDYKYTEVSGVFIGTPHDFFFKIILHHPEEIYFVHGFGSARMRSFGGGRVNVLIII